MTINSQPEMLENFNHELGQPRDRTRTPLPAGISNTLLFVTEESRSMEPEVREVYETIGRYANHDGIAWPSLDRVKTHLRRGKTTIMAAIRSLERSGHLQVTPGHQNYPNRYQLMRPGTNERFISPRNGSQDQLLVPHRTNQASQDQPLVLDSPPQDWKIEREILQILERLQYLLSLLPPEAREWFSRGLMNQSLVPVRTNDGPGTAPLVPNPSFEDYQQSQELQISHWLDEHWPWIQENTNWQDLGGAQKHYRKNPRDFQRLQERYEASQTAPAEVLEDPEYQVVELHAGNEAEAEAIWLQVLEGLEEKLPRPTYESWFRVTQGHCFNRQTQEFMVVCPSSMIAERLQHHYYTIVSQLEQVTGSPLEVQFSIRASA